jgi:hypothetical protein
VGLVGRSTLSDRHGDLTLSTKELSIGLTINVFGEATDEVAAPLENRLGMRFLLRMTFWLGVVLILLPYVGSQTVPKSQVSMSDVLVAASDIVADIQHFCERQPQACVVGSQTTVTLRERAQTGAKILYDFLRDQFGSSDSTSVRTTGGISIPPAGPSQHTLRPTDLTRPWHGPQSSDMPETRSTPAL